MVEPRTVKTLVVLLGAMTVGAMTLYLVSGEPIPPPDQATATRTTPHAAAAISDTQVPLRPARWRHIVIHAAATRDAEPTSRCHFIVHEDGTTEATVRWQRQMQGQGVSSVARSFNSESISICLIGRFTDVAPSQEQLSALVALTRALQAEPFDIGPGHVYLRSDLDAFSDSPGRVFPAEDFAAQLLQSER